MTIQKFDYRCSSNTRTVSDLKAAFEHVVRTRRPLLIVDGRFKGTPNRPFQSRTVDRKHVIATLLPGKPGDVGEFGLRAGESTMRDLKDLFQKCGAVEFWADDTKKTVMAHKGLLRQGNLVFVPTARLDRNNRFEVHPLTAEQSF